MISFTINAPEGTALCFANSNGSEHTIEPGQGATLDIKAGETFEVSLIEPTPQNISPDFDE